MLAAVTLYKGERVEIVDFEIFFNVNAINLAARVVVKPRQRPLIDIAVLRVNLQIKRILPLLGLRDKVVAFGGVGHQ